MTGLAEFLLARIGEDEEAIRSRDLTRPIHFVGCWYYSNSLDAGRACDCDDDGSASHRFLAECDAKRRIVEHHGSNGDDWPLCMICTEVGPDAQGWPCLTLQLLALPYADHPGYLPEWAP